MRLAIITTHPIQYYSPVFKLLHQRNNISIKVFYTWGEASTHKYDPGFNKKIEWDIPLLDGYPYEWVKNTSADPGSHHFKGIITPGLKDQVNSWKADALLVYGWGYHSHLNILRHFKGKMLVLFRGDSTLLDEKKGVKALLKTLFLQWVYQHVDHAFYVGINNKAYFKKFGLKERQLTFAPHAIDNDRFAVDKKEEAKLFRRQHGIKEDELVVVFAGKLEEKKAPGQLLDAFLSLNTQRAHLLFVGNGKLEEMLKLKAKDKPHIHFVDFQNQSMMPVILQACDVFCLPSKGPDETWGLAINEAMACGKAVLVSDKVGAAADLVQPGKNGFIFKAGSVTDMAKHLNALLGMGKNGLNKLGEVSKNIIKSWSFENQAIVFESYLQSLPNFLKND